MKFEIEKFSKRLRELRKEKDVSMEKLADVLGVTHGAISRWEKCENIPGIDHLFGLVKFLGVSAGYLIGVED